MYMVDCIIDITEVGDFIRKQMLHQRMVVWMKFELCFYQC